ncbi:hypothetical protein H4R34_001210 [Dimargaris verticillata]|uniref:Uncharacterized protein n=1 Tax=Dimargaris verticillata TaxID=2761393 RepID=A0A9W8B415_9FUNG|nr:hypothetical protein H4R34_001210 [Dimargaris verticillata]
MPLPFQLQPIPEPSFRLGRLCLSRAQLQVAVASGAEPTLPTQLETPNFLTLTQRAAVPHLTQDTVARLDTPALTVFAEHL